MSDFRRPLLDRHAPVIRSELSSSLQECEKLLAQLNGLGKGTEDVPRPRPIVTVAAGLPPQLCGNGADGMVTPPTATRHSSLGHALVTSDLGLAALEKLEAKRGLSANGEPVLFYEATYDGTAPDTLIFKGGGTKGIVYSGAIKRLEEEHLMEGITKLAGTSAGSQAAALVAFGYSWAELERITKAAPWGNLLDYAGFPCGICRNIRRLFRHYGLCKGAALEAYLDDLFFKKCGRRQCTFQQLHDDLGKELRLGTCNISTRQFEFLDRHSHPDMPVSLAARASSSIPILFRPVRWKDALYVDGGLEGNLPISAFRHGHKVLALNLTSHVRGETLKPPENFLAFLTTSIFMLKEAAQGVHGVDSLSMRGCALSSEGIDVIHIDTGAAGGMNMHMSEKEFNALKQAGYDAVDRYFDGGQRRSQS